MTPATPKLARGAIPKGSEDLGPKALLACWNGFAWKGFAGVLGEATDTELILVGSR